MENTIDVPQKTKTTVAMWSRNPQISSETQSCPTLCNPMNRSMPGLPVHHKLPEFIQTHAHGVGDAIQPSHPVVPFSSCPKSLPASGSFPMSQLFAWGSQSIGVSASASVLPMDTQESYSWAYIYPDRTAIQKNTCTPMFTAALFTTAKTWKHLSINI